MAPPRPHRSIPDHVAPLAESISVLQASFPLRIYTARFYENCDNICSANKPKLSSVD